MKQKFSWLLLLTLGLGTSPMAAEQEPSAESSAPAATEKEMTPPPAEMSAPTTEPTTPAPEAPKAEEPVKVEDAEKPAETEATTEKPKKKKKKKSSHRRSGDKTCVSKCALTPEQAAQKAKQDCLSLKGAPSATVVAAPAEPCNSGETTAVMVAPAEGESKCSTGTCSTPANK